MKVVILAGGYGPRISEESGVRPKPMVEIGGKPILWHIMKIYSYYGLNEFIICCGYKSNVIKEYFANYFINHSDVTFNLENHSLQIHKNGAEPWKVTLVETGAESMTGGRLKRIKDYVKGETFCMTYGDGVSDIDIRALITFHKQQNKLATMTAVQHPGRFGAFILEQNQTSIASFHEKPKGDGAWINGGFFVLEPGIFDYITGDDSIWERDPLQNLAHAGQLVAFRHEGFWNPMDTLRDKNVLNQLWHKSNPPWKIWN